MFEEYSSQWPAKYEEEAKKIREVLGDLVLDVQHIGSTAIPNMPAKPIIDIAVFADSITDIPKFTELLATIGYSYKSDMSSVERIFLRKGDPIEYHLSIACGLHTFWERQILFRDYLIAHPNYAKEYADLKRETIAVLPEEDFADLSRSKGYSAKKGPFVEKILKLAHEDIDSR